VKNSCLKAEGHWIMLFKILKGVALVLIGFTLSAFGLAVQRLDFEGTLHGFPALRDSAGKKLADGDFSQWLESEQLHVRIRYDFGRGRQIEDKSVFRQRPRLIQDAWSFRELRNGKLFREFSVDFSSRTATAKKLEESGLKEWSDKVDVEPGLTFAGFGFTLAVKSFRERLIKGERIELRAIGFTPKPRVVSVEISHGGLDQMEMSSRVLRGDRFVIHPKIPWIAELFVDVPDTHIWLTNPTPASFLRWEGPIVEPKDPIIRVDLLPGGQSGPAKPVGTGRRRR
jgi:hypothetical protein